MNDFDRQLESDLRRYLDPIVMAPKPVRRKRGSRPADIALRAVELTLAPVALVAVRVAAFS